MSFAIFSFRIKNYAHVCEQRRSKQLTLLNEICKNNFLDAEKMPHPPTYTEIYPVVAENEANGPQMGWQHPPATEVVNNTMPVIVQPIQPPPYANQQPGEIRIKI